MPHHLPNIPDHLREPHTLGSRRLWRLYLLAIGVTLLIGWVTGVVWIAWRLFRLHIWP